MNCPILVLKWDSFEEQPKYYKLVAFIDAVGPNTLNGTDIL